MDQHLAIANMDGLTCNTCIMINILSHIIMNHPKAESMICNSLYIYNILYAYIVYNLNLVFFSSFCLKILVGNYKHDCNQDI